MIKFSATLLATLIAASVNAATVDLRIMETTDLHSNMMDFDYYKDTATEKFGLVRTASLINAARDEVKNSVLVDNGDVIQGSPLGDYMAAKGLKQGDIHPVYKAMNLLDYAVGNLGNHEFNYGLDYLAQNMPELADIPIVKISNFVGDALDMAAAEHFEEVLMVGHVGKLVKLAGGIMNTHSHQADCRTELFCTHAALCGAPQPVCRALMDAATTDACLAVLDEAGLRAAVLESLLEAVQLHLDRRAAGAFAVGAVLFSNQSGPLGQTKTADALLKKWKGN